uniref:PilZ domain-containing protein n=1 Tax=uncultured bacterium contig00001 TaxID=1181493 RepID=A0A806KF53_9BACT|nr:hypothetical protein [uncultured bacterium contig00001]
MPLEAEVNFSEIAFDKEASVIKTKYKDVSGGGLLLTSSQELPLGTLIKLEIRVPGLAKHMTHSFESIQNLMQKPLVAVGQIVRIEALDDGQYDLGIKFLNVYPDDLNALLTLINSSDQAAQP